MCSNKHGMSMYKYSLRSHSHKHHPRLSLLHDLVSSHMLITQRHSIDRIILVVTQRVSTSSTHQTGGVVSQQQSSIPAGCLQTLSFNTLSTSRTNRVVGMVVTLLAVWPVVVDVKLESLGAGEVVITSVTLEAVSMPSSGKRVLGRHGLSDNHLVATSARRLSLLFLASFRGRRFALESERSVCGVRMVLLNRHQRHAGGVARVHRGGGTRVDAHIRQRRVDGSL